MERRQLLRFLGTIAPVWGYRGAVSPEHWAELSPDFQLCATGRQQTPIDLPDRAAEISSVLTIDYHPTSLKLTNTGRTICLNIDPGSAITFQGQTFSLRQFHFHHPSEHRIAGQGFDLEIHFVHRSLVGHWAVLAVLARVGAFNPHLQLIWENMPRQVGIEGNISQNHCNIAQLLPENRDFYAYRGSLTTPPCSEGVLWLVLQPAIQISRQQIQQFADLIPRNARPIQPLYDRPIFHS
jgi:carbonic anhydrase